MNLPDPASRPARLPLRRLLGISKIFPYALHPNLDRLDPRLARARQPNWQIVDIAVVTKTKIYSATLTPSDDVPVLVVADLVSQTVSARAAP